MSETPQATDLPAQSHARCTLCDELWVARGPDMNATFQAVAEMLRAARTITLPPRPGRKAPRLVCRRCTGELAGHALAAALAAPLGPS